MRLDSVAWILVLLGPGANAGEEDMHKHDAHFAGVTERGDKGMGFSHEKTVHHFGLTRQGGFISAEASDAADAPTRDSIRRHFQHIAQAFASGDFNLPMFIHAKSPPGVATMKKRKAFIKYRFEETERGGRIAISTANPKALQAVHHFLRFQIEDHRTGDSVAVSESLPN
jgi:hypothetical protein